MKLTDFFKPDMVELIHAIEKGDESKARNLIDSGLSLNVHGDEGITPLLWLIMQKDKPAMRLAIKLGADPDFARPNGDTAITMTAGGNDDELLLILLQEGGNPNAVDRNGHPAMFAAVANERKKQIDMLIRFGADINLTDRSAANSALHAAYINRYEMAYYLIAQGVDYAARSAGHADIAWLVHDGLSKELLNPEYPAYSWALKVKQQLIDRGVKFPPLSPREVRWREGKPNRYDIKARRKELEEQLKNASEKDQREALKKELEDLKKWENK
ncbi:MAG: ankyrin repeat domain-containing protein [Gammaproteobacteria bacterium]|nr:ankyrin repeat domain-containing protein [Gammaproteobacteria bacterium]